MKRIVAMLLVLLLLVTFAVGCNKDKATDETAAPKSETTEAKTTDAAKETQEPEKEETLEITWIVYNQFDYTVDEGSEVQQLLEEKFNVDLTIPSLDVHNTEAWTLYWASGNTADRIMSNNMNTYYKDFADQGLIRSITQDMLYSYAPDWMKTIESVVDKNIAMSQITYDDQLWCMPTTNFAAAKACLVLAARKSWMDAVGIAKAPETLDELHDMYYKFTWEDPDGNGEDDTYGLGAYASFNYVFGAHGIYPTGWYDIDGTITYVNAMDRYKEVLILLNKWYDEGIIDPEFVTDSRDIMRAKWSEGIYGVLEDHPWWFAKSTPNNVSDMVLDKYEGEELVFFPAVTGPYGDAASLGYYPNVSMNGVYFGGETSDEKVQKIMEIENAFQADWDLYVRCYYGVEGETFEYDEDGIISPIKDALTSENIVSLGIAQTFAGGPYGKDTFSKITKKYDLIPYNAAGETKQIVYYGTPFVINGVNEIYNEKSEDIGSISWEYYFNAITGEVDIEETWDDYIQKLNDAGLQEVLAEFENLIVRAE